MKLPSKWTKQKKVLAKLTGVLIIANMGFTLSENSIVDNICYAISGTLLIVVGVLMIVWRGKINPKEEQVPHGG